MVVIAMIRALPAGAEQKPFAREEVQAILGLALQDNGDADGATAEFREAVRVNRKNDRRTQRSAGC
jgi:Flp pilus assembly protein TadD